MSISITEHTRVVVVGLGYVGLPLAVALSRNFDCLGLDIDERRVGELKEGHDRTNEVTSEALSNSGLKLHADPQACAGADIYIVTVPTPVDADNVPDLTQVLSATRTVGQMLSKDKKSIVVYESTVYPGVTEEICGPALAEASGLTHGEDFFLGYSPERINPGDREHVVEKIVKVVAGESPEILDVLVALYGKVTEAGCFAAASIRAAEAAKVIENAQRDINIAFMNEITQIFSRIDLSIWDVLDAAKTKWNFQPFEPGLVGGHCVGVDPFYLSHCAQKAGYEPKVILSGRALNEDMGGWFVDTLVDQHGPGKGSALVMGLTFKKDVPDLRNSKVVDVAKRLREHRFEVTLHDPMADSAEVAEIYGQAPDKNALKGAYDLVICAVDHISYKTMANENIAELVKSGGTLADFRGVWRDRNLPDTVRRWSL